MKAFLKKNIVPLAVIGVGLYLLLKPNKAKASESKPTKPKPTPLSAGYDTYIVTTMSSNLNVRKEPNATSLVIASLPKGTEILATPTADTTDWHTLLDKDLNPKGYISSKFIKKK